MWSLYLHENNSTIDRIGKIVNVHNFTMTDSVSGHSTMSFDTDFSNPLAEYLIEDEQEDRLIFAYKDNPYTGQKELGIVAEIRAVQEKAEFGSATLGVTAVSVSFRLSNVIANNSANDGLKESGLSFPDTPKAILASRIVQNANAGHNTWIRSYESDQGDSDSVAINAWGGFKSVTGAIEELSAGNTLEWMVYPVDKGYDANGVILGKFVSGRTVGAPRASGENAVMFDYNCGQHNVTSAERVREINRINRVYQVRSGTFPYYVYAQDSNNIADHGLREALVPVEITEPTLRQQWADINVAVLKNATRQYSLTVQQNGTPGIPEYLVHYRAGDVVNVRARWPHADSPMRIDGPVRIWSVTVSVDDNGNETCNLQLNPNG